MKRILRKTVFLLAVLMCTVACAVSVSAAPRNGWITKKGVTSYYERGRKVTGLHTIKKNQYYFDKSGILRHGWRKVKREGKWAYCYFSPKKGVLVKSRASSPRTNGFFIDKDGNAQITAANRQKMRMLVKADEILDKITEPAWSAEKKLSASFQWVCTFRGMTKRPFTMQSDWGSIYAEDILSGDGGNCFSYSSAFAFLANAIGYKNVYVCTDTNHGWAEINGLVYDPALYIVNHSAKYYGCTYSNFETRKAASILI